jgi:GntR family transcriptional regulator, rspAB operon transcriptional repressor
VANAKREKPSPAEPEDGERELPLDTLIARRLMQDIIEGVYPPGHWIREQEVASRYGTSRTPVRNAFRQVERQGFILVRPWRGAKVLELSADDTRYVLDMLEAVYGVAMRIAAETLPASRFAELEIMFDAALDAVARNSLPDRVNVAFQIGRRLSRWSGSDLAHDMLNRVGSLALWQHRFLDFDVPAAAQRQVELHRTLIDAIKSRDGDLAEATAREIVALTRSFLVPRVRLQSDAKAPAAAKPAKRRARD